MKVSVSGVRGRFPEDLTLEHIMRFIREFSSMITGGTCALAMDTRESSRVIALTVSAVLREQGIDVYNLGIAPTPVMMRESRASEFGAGVMVTASHNPLDWNGLKFALNGRAVPADVLLQMQSNPCTSEGRRRGIGSEHVSGSTYVDDLLEFLNMEDHQGKGVKVALDTAHGSGRYYMLNILARLGFETVLMDGVMADPTGSDLRHLCDALSSGCTLGIALDMDGDRAMVLTGYKYKPDDTLLICLARAAEMGCRRIAVSIDTSNAVRDLASARNCTLYYSRVGEANVVDAMLRNGCDAGGEGSSAGFIMPGFNMCRDGLLASAMALSMLDSIDEVMEYSSRYHTLRGKVHLALRDPCCITDRLLSMHEYSEFMTLDGVKLVMDESTWVLIRASNTEDAVRLSVESDSVERCTELYRRYERILLDMRG